MKEFKERLLSVCIQMVKSNINNLNTIIEDTENSTREYGQPKDRYDSFKEQQTRKINMYTARLLTAQKQLDALERIDPALMLDQVGFGAIVITNKHKLFVASAIGKIIIDNQTYMAISPVVPLYQQMHGKRANETFVFMGQEIKIIRVY